MKRLKWQPRIAKSGLLILSLIALLGIPTTYVLAGTIFLPVVAHQEQSSSPTITVAPTSSQSTPDPSATPKPPDTIQVTVTPLEKDWAVAFFAKGNNSAGKPIMTIYPSPTSPQSERIKITQGTIVTVLKDPVTADGGGKYWQLVDYKGRDGEDLFLRAVDVTKVTT